MTPQVLISQGNVLSTEAPAILMAIDDAAPGMGGTIARAFERRYPDAWEEIEQDIEYQVGLGRSQILEVPLDLECPFRHVILASTLHHLDVIDTDGRIQILRAALSEALGLAANRSITHMASAVMVGGWRLGLEEAASTMLETYFERYDVRGTLPRFTIHVITDRDYSRLIASLTEKFAIELDASTLRVQRK